MLSWLVPETLPNLSFCFFLVLLSFHLSLASSSRLVSVGMDWIDLGYAAILAFGGAVGYIRKGKCWNWRRQKREKVILLPILGSVSFHSQVESW